MGFLSARCVLCAMSIAVFLGLSACSSPRSFTAALPTYMVSPNFTGPLTGGPFHAQMTSTGACAWLGGSTPSSVSASFLWPPGYRVRFNPTELLDAHGHVVAREGKNFYYVAFTTTLISRCRLPGQSVVGIEPNT
jgi:hypothetical protein